MVLKPNKYLRKIGVDENYWLFNSKDNEGDFRYFPDEEGFVDAEHFSLDLSLSLYIYSQLCYFREHCMCGHPGNMTFEQWKNIINKIIEAFELLIKEDDRTDDYFIGEEQRKRLSKNKSKKINYGMRLFIKYYNHLWY